MRTIILALFSISLEVKRMGNTLLGVPPPPPPCSGGQEIEHSPLVHWQGCNKKFFSGWEVISRGMLTYYVYVHAGDNPCFTVLLYIIHVQTTLEWKMF